LSAIRAALALSRLRAVAVTQEAGFSSHYPLLYKGGKVMKNRYDDHILDDHKLLILVVEDHLIFSKAVKRAIPMHQMIVARTVEEAKEMYEKQLPDMVFLDIALPDGSGHEVLEHIQKSDPQAFVVMLTGSASMEDVQKSTDNGAKGYVLKPFNSSRILYYVKEYLALRQKGVEEHTRHPLGDAAPPAQPDTGLLTTENLVATTTPRTVPLLFVDVYEANRYHVKLNLEKQGYFVDSAADAEEAMTCIQAKHYPVIVIDCELPGDTDGYSLANKIRQHNRAQHKHSVIIGIGQEPRNESKQWLVAGMNDYYNKPLSIKTLTAGLKKIVAELPDAYFDTN